MSSIVHATLFKLLFVSTLQSVTQADEAAGIFLGNRVHHLSNQHGVTADLLEELERVSGRGRLEKLEPRVSQAEDALRPMFAAMPKDATGRVDSTAVRYLLHRLFVQRHGWFVNGLDTRGDAWNQSSPFVILSQHGETDLHGLFESKLNESGFDLHHAAVLAATFEALVHNDAKQRLLAAYRMHGLSKDASLNEGTVGQIMSTYMALYVLELNHTTVTQEEYLDMFGTIMEDYPTWPETEVFVEEVRKRIVKTIDSRERTSWNTTLQVLEVVGETYGRWQNRECHMLKQALLQLEDPDSGRVRLENFYGNTFSGDGSGFNFMESIPYLRDLGALDETDPKSLKVIIPNYVNSPSNCVASSKFYSVCCIDECDGLLGAIESRLVDSQATPSQILQVIENLPSDTVKAPRNLPRMLTERLEEIASQHAGLVPLHGRLFAQWMHHAYPHECQYPHLSGTTKRLKSEDWESHSGESSEASEESIRSIIGWDSNETKQLANSSLFPAEDLPWTAEEELFVCRPQLPEPNRGLLKWDAHLIQLAVLVFVVATICRPKQYVYGSDDETVHGHNFFV